MLGPRGPTGYQIYGNSASQGALQNPEITRRVKKRRLASTKYGVAGWPAQQVGAGQADGYQLSGQCDEGLQQ